MTAQFALAAPRIFDGARWHENAALVVGAELVEAIRPLSDLAPDIAVEVLDEGLLAPGFIDLQVNGGGGVLLNNTPTVEGIRAICAAHARFGTTSLLPTLITDTDEVRNETIKAAIEAHRQRVPGFAGLHLEGPHLSVARKGAHDAELIRPMRDADVAILCAARRDLPALVTTVAPESVTAGQVRSLVAAGVRVSVGHSDAPAEAVLELAAAGANMVTHLFNAMSQLNGRQPGVVGAALSSDDLFTGIIADGFHVHPVSIAVASAAKQHGESRLFLISDAMSSVGTEVVEFELNGRRIRREGGKLLLADGTLAGADLELSTAVRVAHFQSGIALPEALRMASLYPAAAMHWSGPGTLHPGTGADIVWLDDTLHARAVWQRGRRIA